MEVVKISNKKDNLTNDFKYSDFWKGNDFELFSCLPKAIQFIREYYSIPFTITSTYRPNDALTMPEAHRIQPPTIDCVTTDRSKWNDIRNDIRNEFKEWMRKHLKKRCKYMTMRHIKYEVAMFLLNYSWKYKK